MTSTSDGGADASKLMRALQAERGLHRQAAKQRDILLEKVATMSARLEAIEQRQGGGIDMAAVTAGLAAIRGDLRAELMTMRAEVTELAETVAQFVRG